MKKKSLIQKIILLPISKLYGLVIGCRNLMFDWGILKQREFNIPVVVVGNISAGGTGKTPHTEYIINALRHSYHIGVLSRGYKRKTKGFVLATKRSTPLDIGDEPYQMYHKYIGQIVVAVCEDRCKGIDNLLEIDPEINLIILDDAFQHRYVKPKVSIVLTEFNMPIFNDYLLPYGRLRESAKALNRADIVIVSKCPDMIKPIENRIFKNNLNLSAYQKLFFSKYVYGNLIPLFPDNVKVTPRLDWLDQNDTIMALSGIGNPRPFVKHLKRYKAKVKISLFPDHHYFSRKDVDAIKRKFESLQGNKRYIITTEKDAVRLINNPYFPHELKSKIFYLPISVSFDNHDESSFDETIRKLIAAKIN